MADALNTRLAELCDRFGKANLARRCGIPPSSISRYLAGAKLPGSVLEALVAGLNVNPAWLLAGEPPVMRHEVASGGSALAQQLLELVESMKQVTRLSMGAVLSSDRMRTLLELQTALGRYRDQLSSAGEIITPALRSLVASIEELALKHGDWYQAESLASRVEALAELCGDERLRVRIDSLIAMRHAFHDEYDAALAANRRALWRAMSLGPAEPDALQVLHSQIHLLSGAERSGEAERAVRACIELSGTEVPALNALLGAVLLDRGRASEGLPLLLRNLDAVPDPAMRAALAFDVARGQRFCGVTPDHDVDDPHGATAAIVYGTILEDAGLLDAALIRAPARRLSATYPTLGQGAPLVMEYGRCLLAGTRGDLPVLRRFVTEHLDAERIRARRYGRMWRMATRAQACRVLGDLEAAREAALVLHRWLASPAPGESASVRTRALYAAGALRVCRESEATHAHALATLQELIDGGYWGFKCLVRAGSLSAVHGGA